MRPYLQILAMTVLFAICSLVAGCTKDNFDSLPENKDGAEVTADPTHCNFTLNLRSESGVSTRGADDGSTINERKITNLILMFFNADNLKLEVAPLFTDMQPVGADGDKYMLKKPMQITAGRKKVVALANVSSDLRPRLAAIKTYGEIKNFLLNTNAGATPGYLKEMGVTNITIGKLPNEYEMGIENGLLMTGECETTLKAGVTATEAMAGTKNNISNLYVDRAVVKIVVEIPSGFYTSLSTEFPYVRMIEGVYSPYIFLRNLPQESFLLKRDGGISPYYNSVDFTKWSLRLDDLRSKESPSDTQNKTYTVYVPENTFSTAYRGNATHLIVRFRVGHVSNFWYGFFAFYDQAKDSTFFYKGPYINDGYGTGQIKGFFDSKRNSYMEGRTLNEVCVMPANDRTKAAQDAVLLNGRTTVPAGYYLFIYRANISDPTLKSEVWYDEMQLYKYTGNGLERVNRQDFKSAYYNSDIYFRVNLTDILLGDSSSKRYSINRNVFFTVNIKGVTKRKGTGFEVPGYPSPDDLERRPGDKLTESGMGLDITVTKWNMGGGTNVDIED